MQALVATQGCGTQQARESPDENALDDPVGDPGAENQGGEGNERIQLGIVLQPGDDVVVLRFHNFPPGSWMDAPQAKRGPILAKSGDKAASDCGVIGVRCHDWWRSAGSLSSVLPSGCRAPAQRRCWFVGAGAVAECRREVRLRMPVSRAAIEYVAALPRPAVSAAPPRVALPAAGRGGFHAGCGWPCLAGPAECCSRAPEWPVG